MRKTKVKTKKKAPARRKKKNSKGRLLVVRLLSSLLLIGLLLFSMGAAGYVIFFRTAVAHGMSDVAEMGTLTFEEPYSSIPELPADIARVEDSSLPLVAIIIDDMGYHKKIGSDLIGLPLNLTFSFLAAAPFSKELEEEAFQHGRIILLHLPMQPKGKNWDPGPGALLLNQDPEEQKKIFYQNLVAVPHAVGLNNHMGSLYTENREAMDSLMVLVRKEGLFFIDSFTTAESKGLIAARVAGVATDRRHVFLDNVHSADKVCNQLESLVQRAEKDGRAIGIGHPNKATLTALTDCRGKLLHRVRLVSAQEMLVKLEE